MARKKEYNREDILDLATNLFWQKGFKATSMSELVKATGLNKYSMYEEFGSKDGLFKEAIFTYINKIQKDNIALLSKEPLGLSNIESFLLNRINYATSKESKGCMVINTLAEKESISQEIFADIEMILFNYEEEVLRCLQSAQDIGDISASKDLNILAKYILNFSTGVLINGKLEQKREYYIDMLEFLMSSIRN
jgi:TetR/AcrR family transcriptional repressor of nem operon